MTIKELIEVLEECNPNVHVFLTSEGGDYELEEEHFKSYLISNDEKQLESILVLGQ